MLRKFVCAAAVSLLASAGALAETWEFSYTGFYVESEEKFVSDYTWRGQFSGADTDNDGVLEFNELTSFRLFEYEYGLGSGRYCDPGTYCELESFSYHLSGELDFTAEKRYSDENGSFSTTRTIAGDRITTSILGAGGSTTAYSVYWTPQTQFMITPPPVPEPGTLAMLVAGLGMLCAARWRSKLVPAVPLLGVHRAK